MKFSQIEEGQQFVYQGTTYTRVGPIMASDENGNRKMIPRSAEVMPVSGTVTATEPLPNLQQHVTVEQAIQSFDIFYEQLDQCLQNAVTEETKLIEVQQCLAKARLDFMRSFED